MCENCEIESGEFYSFSARIKRGGAFLLQALRIKDYVYEPTHIVISPDIRETMTNQDVVLLDTAYSDLPPGVKVVFDTVPNDQEPVPGLE